MRGTPRQVDGRRARRVQGERIQDQSLRSVQGFGEEERLRWGTLVFHYWEWCEQPHTGLVFSVRLVVGTEHDHHAAYVAVGASHKTAVQ
jgi:hypothetical protein